MTAEVPAARALAGRVSPADAVLKKMAHGGRLTANEARLLEYEIYNLRGWLEWFCKATKVQISTVMPKAVGRTSVRPQ